ncbi:MAG: hypothetical protein IJN62_05850 [Clostridia bacterium]|nr:hypothetical protein [Clostridia bacterium]
MKKLLTILLCIILTATTVCAAPDGMCAQPTDIKVILHGKEIPSCAVNNAMYIAADDLGEYGYTVTYVDEVRTLFVNKTHAPSDIMPKPCNVKNALSTDIQVMLNGELLEENSKFASNGKMYICANTITYYVSGQNVFDTGIPRYKYNLMPTWDGENRIYYIDDAPLPSKEEQVADFLSYNGNREEYSTFLSFTETRLQGEGFEIVGLRVGGLPHGSNTFWYYCADDGKSYSINTVVSPFRMHQAWGQSSIKDPRIEGRRLYFEGQRTMSLIDYSQGIYYGTYYLDLDTTVVNVVEETRS